MGNKMLLYQKDIFYKDSLECQQICNWIGKGKRVLEVGCHTADLGVILKENDNGVEKTVFGPGSLEEFNSMDAEIAAMFYNSELHI